MARNIAKAFANMTLLYWAPVITGSGVVYERPVEFRGKYIGNTQIGDGSPGSEIFSGGTRRDNMVLFYMCKPEVEGYVSWELTLAQLTADGLLDSAPSELASTHKIKLVDTYVMIRATTPSLENSAFIAQVQ